MVAILCKFLQQNNQLPSAARDHTAISEEPVFKDGNCNAVGTKASYDQLNSILIKSGWTCIANSSTWISQSGPKA